jgi:hypothetical protein
MAPEERLMADQLWDPEPETPTEARRAEELRRSLREERTAMDIREAEIRARWEDEEAAKIAERREEEGLRGEAWDLRERMIDQLRDTPLRADPKSDWMMRLQKNPTSDDLARLQADIAGFHGSSGLLPDAVLRVFLTSFQTDVDKLRRLVLRYERKFT